MTIYNIISNLLWIWAIGLAILAWIVIYITYGGKHFKTTNEYFVSAIIFVGLVCALGYIIVRDIL